MTRALVTAILLVVGLAVGARAQTMSVSASTVTLAAPDTLAYDSGRSAAGFFTVMLTGCGAALGCRVTIEDAGAASAVPVDLEWRLVSVSQTGEGDLECVASGTLLTWQPVGATPGTVMETGQVTTPGSCMASLEVRVSNLAYQVHQFTSPPSTYWRDLRIRAAEK